MENVSTRLFFLLTLVRSHGTEDEPGELERAGLTSVISFGGKLEGPNEDSLLTLHLRPWQRMSSNPLMGTRWGHFFPCLLFGMTLAFHRFSVTPTSRPRLSRLTFYCRDLLNKVRKLTVSVFQEDER